MNAVKAVKPLGVWQGAGRRIHITDVGMRDGLQSEQSFVPTEAKIALVEALADAGLPKIEVTAFVSPKAIPALRDGEAVMREIRRRPGTLYTALVPNVRGAERALAAGVNEMNLVMSVSETHNLCNLRMTRAQSFVALGEVAALAEADWTPVNVSLSCAFGCPMEGDVPTGTVLEWAARHIEVLGASGITLCDTTGMAHPAQVAELVAMFRECWPEIELTLHFHNTRGLGLANVLAAIDAGATRFDASVGGLGGCPYAPGATGNVCTEEVVHALGLMGYDTGIDLGQLITVARALPSWVGHEVPSQIAKAVRRDDLHQRPHDFDAIRERALAR